MGKKKSSMLNVLLSARILNKVQSLGDKNAGTSLGAVQGKDDISSASLAETSKKIEKDVGVIWGQLGSKSSSLSRTLEDNDTESECSSEKLPAGQAKAVEDNLFDKMPETKEEKAPSVNIFRDNRNHENGLKLQLYENQPDEIVLDELDLDDVDSS